MGTYTSQSIKRIEIILLQNAMAEVAENLVSLGVKDYSIIDDILGRGDRGLRAGVGLGTFQYQYLLIACNEDQLKPVLEMVNPYIKRFGGLCMTTDAKRIIPNE